MKRLFALTALVALSACNSAPKKAAPEAVAPAAKSSLPQSIEAAVASDYRTPKNKARDGARHPAETLAFFGLRPDMTVVEVWPSGGWYAEILAPFLAETGHYIGAVRPPDPEEPGDQKLQAWMTAHPDASAKVTMTKFDPPSEVTIAPAGSADMVLTFRNVHNWEGAQAEAFKAFFKALKPGGILGIVEHRAADGKKPKKDSGYVREKDVIRFAEKAGFRLEQKTEINANLKDTKNHPHGVWSLPPSLKGGDVDRDKYTAIGETDRMTLKFIKPGKG